MEGRQRSLEVSTNASPRQRSQPNSREMAMNGLRFETVDATEGFIFSQSGNVCGNPRASTVRSRPTLRESGHSRLQHSPNLQSRKARVGGRPLPAPNRCREPLVLQPLFRPAPAHGGRAPRRSPRGVRAARETVVRSFCTTRNPLPTATIGPVHPGGANATAGLEREHEWRMVRQDLRIRPPGRGR